MSIDHNNVSGNKSSLADFFPISDRHTRNSANRRGQQNFRRSDRLLQGGLRPRNRHEVRHGGVDCELDRSGTHAGVRAQEDQHLPLRLRHEVQEPQGGRVSRQLRKEMLNLIQTGLLQCFTEKVFLPSQLLNVFLICSI